MHPTVNDLRENPGAPMRYVLHSFWVRGHPLCPYRWQTGEPRAGGIYFGGAGYDCLFVWGQIDRLHKRKRKRYHKASLHQTSGPRFQRDYRHEDRQRRGGFKCRTELTTMS